MILRYLRADHYRNIEHAEILFSPGVNLIVGDNAQGKTNALEAIYTFARGKSFRGASDSELSLFGQNHYSIEIGFQNQEREQSLAMKYENREKVRTRNGIRLEKQMELLGHFRAVLFCPEHLSIVKGSPAERRQFINIAIGQCYPAYMSVYAEYSRFLENRNALLKLAQKGIYADSGELEAFSRGLAKCAAVIYRYRMDYIRKLEKKAVEIHSRLSGGKEELQLRYDCDLLEEMTKEEAECAYFEKFTRFLSKESIAGCTLYGIHRDDLLLTINEKPVREYGSQGQQRSTVLSLKLAEGEVCGEICGEYPVYLFDDVLSELDENRRSVVVTGDGKRQYLITACETSVYHGDANCILTKRGTYVSAHRER